MAADNPYLELFLRGYYKDLSRSVPWLYPHNVERIRHMLNRITLIQAEIGDFLSNIKYGDFSKAALSNIFEYMSTDRTITISELLQNKLCKTGRFCYWNFLVPRSIPSNGRISSLPIESKELWKRDRSWLYSAFFINSIN